MRHVEVLGRAAARLRVGQPFLLGPDGAADVRVNRWFASEEIRGLEPLTWRKYAYSLAVWLTFLSSRGCRWDDADPVEQEAFKVWRVTDARNARLVTLGTYKHDLIAVRLFYLWAAAEYGVANPVRMRRGRGCRRDGSPAERPATAPVAVRDRDVKWFDPAGYGRYRDVGLLGLTVDGRDDPGFRGRNSQRDAAFADGLYGTGLRLREWGSILVAELPPDDPSRGYYTCRLAAAVAKGRVGRRYWMPRWALQDALGYVEGERATAVRRGRRAGRYERMAGRAGIRIVTGMQRGRRVRLRRADSSGSVSEVSLDALAPAARLGLLWETPEGLEPAALWLNEDGLPRHHEGWEHTFTTANARLARLGLVGFAGAPHMLRHSFALRWYAVGRVLYEARYAHLTEEETRDFRQQFGNAWDLVQLLLGHRDQRTTQETYLEPFRSLEMEMLLLHATTISPSSSTDAGVSTNVDSAVQELMTAMFGTDRRVLGDPVALDNRRARAVQAG